MAINKLAPFVTLYFDTQTASLINTRRQTPTISQSRTSAENKYAFEEVESGSYHYGWGPSSDEKDEKKLNDSWDKLMECTV